MKRKEWLETFLKLVDRGAPMIKYRKYLRLFQKDVKKHLKRIGEYRQELESINLEEKKQKELKLKAIHERMQRKQKEDEEKKYERARKKKEEKFKAARERIRKTKDLSVEGAEPGTELDDVRLEDDYGRA